MSGLDFWVFNGYGYWYEYSDGVAYVLAILFSKKI